MNSFDVRLGSGQVVPMASPFEDAGERFQEAIDRDQSGSVVGDAWSLAVAFVLAGIDWPGWIWWHQRCNQDYIRRLYGNPQYREAIWASEAERKKIMWDRAERAISLGGAGYLPEGVRLPQFLEGKPARPSVIRKAAARRNLPDEVLRDWFLRSFDSQQASLGANQDFDPRSWKALRDAGLVVSGQDVPLDAVLNILTMSELRELQLALCGGAEKSHAAGRARLLKFAVENEEAVRVVIGRGARSHEITMILPPPGVSWADFQSWRQQAKGMATAITDLYTGDLSRHTTTGKLLLSNERPRTLLP